MRAQSIAIPQQDLLVASRWLMFLFLGIAAYMLLIDVSFAAGQPSAMGNILCKIVSFFQGNLGRGLGTLAIIIVGIGAMLGKVSWGLALIVIVGIVLMTSADAIFTNIAGSNVGPCTM